MRKFREDRGDSVLIPAMISMMFVFLVVGLVIDVSKGSMAKSDMTSKAQQASQVAVKTVDARGSMNWDAAIAFSEEYEFQRFGKPRSEKFINLSRANQNTGTRESAAYDLKDADGKRKCSTGVVDGKKVDLPYYEFTLHTSRGGKSVDTQKWNTSDPSSGGFGKLNPNARYRAIDVVVHDATPNMLLGSFGFECQPVTASVGAISFASQSDL